LEGRVGFVPGETKKQVQEQIEQTVAEAVREDRWCREHPPQVEWFGWMTDPWVEPQDSPFLKKFLSVGERVLGGAPVILGSSGGLDNRFAPYFDTPSFSFGPAGGNHHSIDEYVEIPSLLRVTKMLAVFAVEWCGSRMVRLDRINGKGYRPSISFEKSGDEGIAPKGDKMKKADLIKMRQENVSNVIRHLVPLVVTDAQLDKGLQILDEAMAEKVE